MSTSYWFCLSIQDLMKLLVKSFLSLISVRLAWIYEHETTILTNHKHTDLPKNSATQGDTLSSQSYFVNTIKGNVQ